MTAPSPGTGTGSEDAATAAGSIALRFDTLDLVVWPGIFGMLPASLWLSAILYPLSLLSLPTVSGPWQIALIVVASAAGMFVVMILPGLAAGLVQRARQPNGARVAWDSNGLVEWDGGWARTTIPWERLEVSWQRRPLRATAWQTVQLRDRETGALIHVWDLAPSRAGPVRRRIYSESIADLLTPGAVGGPGGPGGAVGLTAVGALSVTGTVDCSGGAGGAGGFGARRQRVAFTSSGVRSWSTISALRPIARSRNSVKPVTAPEGCSRGCAPFAATLRCGLDPE